MALTQADILKLAEPVEEMYINCSSQLIINIAEHFKTGKGLPTMAWQTQKLAEMGQLTEESINIIAANTGQKAETVKAALTAAVSLHMGEEEKLLQSAAKKGLAGNVIGTLETSGNVQAIVKAYADQATDKLNLVNTVMLESTANRYYAAIMDVSKTEEALKIQALTSSKGMKQLSEKLDYTQKTLNSATGSVLLGTESRQQALRGAIKDLADNGITGFIDAGGHHWTPEAYVNMDIRTTVGNTARQAQRARAEEYGVETFQISSHAAPRPLCAPYQGWICSWAGGGYTVEDLHGNEYPVHDINETSYGEPAGIFGINCGHNPITFVPGFSVPRYQELTPEQEEQNKIQYAESQQQRHLEREVRQAKTEALAYKAAGDQEGFEKAAQKVKQKTADYTHFCESTNRTPRYDRTQIGGYNRSMAAQVNQAAKGFTPVEKEFALPKIKWPEIKPPTPATPVMPVTPIEPAIPPKKEYMTQAKLKSAIDDIEIQQAAGNADPALQAEKEKLQAEYSKKYAKSQQHKLDKQISKLDAEMANFDTSKTYSGIWYNQDDITIQNWAEKSGSIAKKQEYYANKLATLAKDDPEYAKILGLSKDLAEFNDQGAKYYALQHEKNLLTSELAKVSAKDYNYFASTDPAAVYSEARKNAALWANTPAEADRALRKTAGTAWRDMTSFEKDSLYGYTQSYSKINEPLRGYHYGTNKYIGPGKVDLDQIGVDYKGYKPGEVHKQITAMHDAIEKSSYDFDIWTRRGCDYAGMDKFFDVPEAILRNGTQEELEAALLGKEITEYGYMSMGVAKGRGFTGKPIEMEIFVPKGTKMMYLEPLSAYGRGAGRAWDGISEQRDYGQELEALLQNGTQFRIADVQRKNGRVKVVLEVIGQLGIRP